MTTDIYQVYSICQPDAFLFSIHLCTYSSCNYCVDYFKLKAMMSCNSDLLLKTDRLKHLPFVVFLNNLKLRLLWIRKPFSENFPVSLSVICNDNIKAEFYSACYDSDIKLGCHLPMFTYLNFILCFIKLKEALAGEMRWILQYMYCGYFCVDSYSPALLWSHWSPVNNMFV